MNSSIKRVLFAKSTLNSFENLSGLNFGYYAEELMPKKTQAIDNTRLIGCTEGSSKS
jgi:hypothetical protein